MNFTADREEFAAKATEIQVKDESYLLGSAKYALRHYGEDGWYDSLLRRVEQVARTAYRRESGHITSDDLRARLKKMHDELVDSLQHVRDPEGKIDQRAAALAKSMASLANAVGVEAASHDDEDDIGLEWVSMHDDKVRDTHREADGQVRRPNEKYDVGGFAMSRPGDTTVPIELWINCRCSLRPVRMEATAVTASTTTATGVTYTIDTSTADHITFDPPVELEAAAATEEDQIDFEEIDDIEGVDDVETIYFHGVLAPEGVPSGDGRMFRKDVMRWRDLPLPMAWQKVNAEGHDGSVVVGHIDEIWRDENSLIHYEGAFTASPESDEAIGLVADSSLRGVSVDVDDATMAFEDEDGNEVTFDAMLENEDGAKFYSVLTDGRICGATMCAIPAFQEAYMALGPHPDKPKPAIERAHASLDAALEAATADGSIFSDSYVKTEDGPGWLTHPVDTERLRRYWTKGKGAAKIRWGVPGDFNRCRAQLAKYIKPIYLSGYCANRHYDALGFWPGRPVAADTINFAISEKPWDGDASRFTIEEWRRSCLIDTGEGDPDSKSRYKLPVKEPNGDLSRAGVHAAAGRINQTDAPAGKISSARAALRRAYDTLGEEPPDTLGGLTESFHLVAAADRGLPPFEWFSNPGLIEPTRLTVTDEGHVFGHLAVWGVCHIGIDGVCTTPPPSSTDYSWFIRGTTPTQDGIVRTGVLTMGTGHAGPGVTPRTAAGHYDNTGFAACRVAIGEDEIGIWFSGDLMPGVTDEQIAQMRAVGSVSGDWRNFSGMPDDLDLCAALIVNVPGFPIPATEIAASGGHQTALVASGIVTAACDPRSIDEIVADAIEEHFALIERRKAMAELAVRAGRDPASQMAALAAARK